MAGLSRTEQDAIIGRTLRELEDHKTKLARYREKADRLAGCLERAAEALRCAQEGSAKLRDLDRCVIAVEELPEKGEVVEVCSGIRRNHNIVRNAEERLKDMLP